MPSQLIPLFPDAGGDTSKVQGIPVSTVDPTNGQILVYNSATAQYEPQTGAAISGLGTAATRNVGQAAGNVLELNEPGEIFLLGDFNNGFYLRNDDGTPTFTSQGFEVTIPTGPGNLALTSDLTALQSKAEVKSGNFTAINDGVYTLVATGTATDPSPVEGKGFIVFVRNGTATVGGTGYATAGTIIRRVFHSGSWANYEYSVAGGGGGVPTSRTISTTAPLTGGGDLSANRTLALTFATDAQAVAGTSTTLPVPPASLLLSLLNSGLRTFTFTTGTTVTTGSGTGSLDSGMSFRLNVTNTTAGSILRRTGVTNSIYGMSHLGTSQLGVNWGKAWGFSARFSPTQTWAAGNRALICVMKDRTQAFGLVGSAAFFFIEVDNLVLKAGYWNGSAATRSNTLATLAANQVAEVILLGDGAGTLSIYLNGSLSTTLSSVSTTNENSTEQAFNLELENTGAGNAAWINIAYPIKFWSYN